MFVLLFAHRRILGLWLRRRRGGHQYAQRRNGDEVRCRVSRLHPLARADISHCLSLSNRIARERHAHSMRLIGAPTLADVTPEMVDITALTHRQIGPTIDHMMANNYEALSGVGNGLGAKGRL